MKKIITILLVLLLSTSIFASPFSDSLKPLIGKEVIKLWTRYTGYDEDKSTLSYEICPLFHTSFLQGSFKGDGHHGVY